MSVHPVSILHPSAPMTPLVIDSPHSGRDYPPDFDYGCPLLSLRQTEDFLVDELIDGATKAGATVILARFPRSYIDVNRAENDIDPDLLAEPWPSPLAPSPHTRQGLGLVRRLGLSGVPVYAAPLDPAQIMRRIEVCYRPYHAALQAAIDERCRLFGASFLIDMHSMPDGKNHMGGRRADFVLGDRNGESCVAHLTHVVGDSLQDMGYSVALNDPYSGVEIARRYGQPQHNRNALQLEINRRLYMDETRLEKHEGFARVRRDLTRLFESLSSALMEDRDNQLAAE